MTKIICKTSWAACETFWLTLDYVYCFCWHKIRYTKRVYRGRRRIRHGHLSTDVELGYKSAIEALSDDESALNNYHASSLIRKRKSRERFRRGRTKNVGRCRNSKRLGSTINYGRSVRLSKNQVSVHSIGKSQRIMRRRRKRRKHHHKQMHMSNLREIKRSNTAKFKKQRTT